MEPTTYSTTPSPPPVLEATIPPPPHWVRVLQQIFRVLLAIMLVGCCILAYAVYALNNKLDHVQTELARRQQNNDAVATEAKTLAKQAFESLTDVQTKYGQLDRRIAESQSQQASLEQMYQELARNRDEWSLAEVEQVLATASQQLQLSGNVQGALIALANADMRLSQGDRPQFINIRRALAHDVERLKALPALDLPGLALQLDEIAAQIDALPLLSDGKLPTPIQNNKEVTRNNPSLVADKLGLTTPNKEGEATLNTEQAGFWQQFQGNLRQQLTQYLQETGRQLMQLVRVREVQKPDALFTTPEQAYFIRENIRLRLLNARFALLSRNESLFRADLSKAQQAIAQYFDTNARKTQAVLSGLRQIQGSLVSIDMPTLADSLAAVRNYKPRNK